MAKTKISVMPASRMFSAISFGVFCRTAPSTSAIMRSRKVEPCAAVIRTLSQSEVTRVPPVTAERSPPLSRMTGADSPVIADSSTEATPSMTSPSLGIRSPVSTSTRSPCFERGRVDQIESARLGGLDALRLSLGARPTQGVGLRLATTFGHRFGEIGEQHGEPQPDGDLAGKQRVAADDLAAADKQVAQEEHGRQHRDDLDTEHDRVLDQGARIELFGKRPRSPARSASGRTAPCGRRSRLYEPARRHADDGGEIGHLSIPCRPEPLTARRKACPGSSRPARSPAPARQPGKRSVRR